MQKDDEEQFNDNNITRQHMEGFFCFLIEYLLINSCFSLACVFPFGAWLFSLLDHFSLLLSFLCSTSLILSLYILFLIIQQSYLLIHGQTWHEYGKNIQIFNTQKHLQSNLRNVFGKRWHLTLFSPLISSVPLGDGMTFDMTTINTGDNQKQQRGIKQN